VLATSLTLLGRLQQAPTPADWKEVLDLYRPLIRSWLARVPGLRDEIDDQTQEVLLIVVREIPGFTRQREGSFRAWLRGITVNRIRGYWRARKKQPLVGLDSSATEDFLDRLADPAGELATQWNRDHDQHVVNHLLAAVRGDFQPATWEAFRRFALAGVPASQVGQELGLSAAAVMLAKARVLKRLREEAGDLLD
jgi:RNA polymerase sigma-70 factor, ECF subfamily